MLLQFSRTCDIVIIAAIPSKGESLGIYGALSLEHIDVVSNYNLWKSYIAFYPCCLAVSTSYCDECVCIFGMITVTMWDEAHFKYCILRPPLLLCIDFVAVWMVELIQDTGWNLYFKKKKNLWIFSQYQNKWSLSICVSTSENSFICITFITDLTYWDDGKSAIKIYIYTHSEVANDSIFIRSF